MQHLKCSSPCGDCLEQPVSTETCGPSITQANKRKEFQSPLPPGAHNIIEKIKDIYENVFANDLHGINESITDENINPNKPSSTCFLEEDPLLVGYQNAASPDLLSSKNLHALSLNNSSALSLLNTTLISDLSPFLQSITPAVDNNGQTPIPSPAKPSGEAGNDFVCPTHDNDTDYSNCPSINTVVSSCQSSPAPLIRCRGKKRVQNYDVTRKRLTNGGKEYSFKKGLLVPAKTMDFLKRDTPKTRVILSSVIERAAEHKTIYTPDEWKLLVRWAKVTGEFSFIESRRGNKMLSYKGYNFSLEKSRNVSSKKRWRCTRWQQGCRAFVVTVEDEIVKIGNSHLNH
ncbi:unnamed protein product [Pieris macdunnoughi]|uniref:FLYWCH-type domain-containing protein n=1 Tax=Pieris macdunnoughi TaxID=345717 RepID=A0A821QA25_9NEOP|nr:unnamed protein product [Pieris macdunnoughi]